MLPFRLNLPQRKASKRKREDADDLFLEGGPLQRAIVADLEALLPEFQRRIQLGTSLLEDGKHLPIGFSFGQFRDICASTKLALVHTRLSPPRCDMNSYSQLLYASCFSLLRKAFRDQSSMDFTLASLALFLLYALYETNPLPQAPTTDHERLSTLPFAVFNPENTKLIYRRSYLQKIRIDQEHFAYIVQLHSQALAIEATCERNRLQCAEGWTCTCCMALDVPSVIDRIVPNLQPCSYTGPCGLEAIGGHPDYPFSSMESTEETTGDQRTTSTMQQSNHETAEEQPQHVGSPEQKESYRIPASLTETIAAYTCDRELVQNTPAPRNPTQSWFRSRKALAPMFRGGDYLKDMSTDCEKLQERSSTEGLPKRVKVRRVNPSFATIEIPVVGEHWKGNTGEPSDVDDNPIDLVLPAGISPELDHSLICAVEELCARDKPMGLALATEKANVETVAGGKIRDEPSVLSSISGVGRRALSLLLARSQPGHSAESVGPSVASTHTGVGRDAIAKLLAYTNSDSQQRPNEPSQGDAFLGGFEDDEHVDVKEPSRPKRRARRPAYLSDLSSSDEESESTTAGRKALRDLLAFGADESAL